MVGRGAPRGPVDLHGRGARSDVWVVQCSWSIPITFLLGLADLHPVVLAILHTTGILERLCEELTQIVVIGRVLEAEVANIREILDKLVGKTLAQLLDLGGLLFFSDLLVLLLVSSSLETLPGQTTAQKVHEYVAESLEIVSPRLFSAKMGIDTHVAGSSREGLSLPIRNVLLGFRVAILFCHTEVDDVNNVRGFRAGAANQEVVRLDIAVDEVLLVDSLHSRELNSFVSRGQGTSKPKHHAPFASQP